jgi:hypothetical protein
MAKSKRAGLAIRPDGLQQKRLMPRAGVEDIAAECRYWMSATK